MDLDRLKINRGASAARGRSRAPRWVKWCVTLAVVGVVFWLLRAPIGRFYARWTRLTVEVARATRVSPLAASAVSGTAANGYIVAARRAALSADTPGRVVELNVREGSVVKKGDLVARLYSKEYEAALRRAVAELGSAASTVGRRMAELEAAKIRVETQRANVSAAAARVTDMEALVELAKKELRREEQLIERNTGTEQAVDEATTKFARSKAQAQGERALLTFARGRIAESEAGILVAEASLHEAESAVTVKHALRDEAAAFLEKTQVRAPFDGIVVFKDAEIGEVVSPNSQGGSSRGSVVTMVDLQSLEAQVDLPEKSLGAVEVGTLAKVYLDAFPEIAYTGRVQRIWPTANRQKGTVELRVAFDAPDERLRPEMGVRVVFRPRGAGTVPALAGDETPVVLIPETCVTRIGGKTGVFELERDTARWRRVDLGEKRGGRVVVESGLEGGELLVAVPPPELEDGDRVNVRQ